MKQLLKPFLTVLLILVMASSLVLALYHWDNKYTKPGTQAIAGILFVEESDWQNTPLRFLWNGWLFCPDRLLTPAEMKDLDTSTLVSLIIGEHNNFSFANKEHTPQGCGTYLLTLQLPATPHHYAIELPEIFSAYRFYVNDELLLEMGSPDAESYKPLIQNRIVSFTASGTTRLMLAVRDEDYIYSGLIYPPAFGEPQAVDDLQNMRLFICAMTVTATLLFALLSLWVSLSTERKRENTDIFFLLCMCIAVFISYFVIHCFLPMQVLPWYVLELVSGYLATLLIVMLHNRLCETSPWVQRISVSLLGTFCVLIFLYGCMATRVTQPIADFFTALIPLFKIGTALYLLIASFRSIYQYKQKSSLLFYADVFYAAMLIWDRLLPAYEPIMGGWFQEWGSLALVAALGIILWQDVTLGYRLSLTFHEERRQMERQIGIQEEHYNQISRKVEESRRMRHDFRQHLRTIAGMADNGSAILDYINKIEAVSEAARPEHYFNNLAIDALLYHYISAAREKEYHITIRVEVPKNAPLPDDVAFCTILGNLLENALEACGRQQEGERFIHLFFRWQHDNIHILLENSFDGIITPSRNGYHSRKHEGEGIGIISVRKLTEQLHGTAEFLPEGNVFQAMLVLPTVHSDKKFAIENVSSK